MVDPPFSLPQACAARCGAETAQQLHVAAELVILTVGDLCIPAEGMPADPNRCLVVLHHVVEPVTVIGVAGSCCRPLRSHTR